MNRASRIIACDPGPERSALVVVGPGHGLRVVLERAEYLPSDATVFRQFLEETGRPELVAIEVAEGHAYAPCRVPGLLAQNVVGGELSGLATAIGVPVKKAPADLVRRQIIGAIRKGQNADTVIARALPLFVTGMHRSNVHVRDALVMAVWGARIVWGRAARFGVG